MELVHVPGIEFRDTREFDLKQILALYRANHWSSAEKPDQLYPALLNSHSLISAWDGTTLVGLGNAISDGFLVVYYPHLLVLPAYQRKGIGKGILTQLISRYKGFHQHLLVADGDAIAFYQSCGFTRAGNTSAMWIYAGNDH